MVAVKGDRSDEEAIKLACDLVRPTKGTIYALYVIEVGREQPVDVEDAAATSRGEEILQRVEGIAQDQKCQIEAELLQAREVGPAVVRQAMDKGVELVIVGLSYKKRYGAFSLGDTVPYVLKHAPCRVAVWREPISPMESEG